MTERTSSVDIYEQYANAVPHWYMDAAELIDVIEYYEDHQRHADADRCLRQALALHPHDDMLKVKEAYSLRSAGKLEEALKTIEKLNPEMIEVRFFMAEEALANFNLKEAKRIYDGMLENGPKPNWNLRLEIAECYLGEGYTHECEDVLRPIPDNCEEAKRAHILMSECLYNRHDVSGAIAELNKALDIDPYDVDNWSMLAEMQYETHRVQEAQEACQYALAIRHNDEKALRVSFFCHLVAKEFSQALEKAALYVQHWPNEYYMPMNAGEVCVSEGRMEEALRYFSRANRNCPDEHQDRIRIITDMAQAQACQGRMEEAFQTLQCACACGSQYTMVCIQMAAIAADLGQPEYAAERLQEIVEDIRPNNPEICSAAIDVMRTHQVLFALCPEVARAIQRLNTSIS